MKDFWPTREGPGLLLGLTISAVMIAVGLWGMANNERERKREEELALKVHDRGQFEEGFFAGFGAARKYITINTNTGRMEVDMNDVLEDLKRYQK